MKFRNLGFLLSIPLFAMPLFAQNETGSSGGNVPPDPLESRQGVSKEESVRWAVELGDNRVLVAWEQKGRICKLGAGTLHDCHEVIFGSSGGTFSGGNGINFFKAYEITVSGEQGTLLGSFAEIEQNDKVTDIVQVPETFRSSSWDFYLQHYKDLPRLRFVQVQAPPQFRPGVNPRIVEYYGAIQDGSGRVVYVDVPLRNWDYDDFRVFMGQEGEMTELRVIRVDRFRDGGTTRIRAKTPDGQSVYLEFPSVFRKPQKIDLIREGDAQPTEIKLEDRKKYSGSAEFASNLRSTLKIREPALVQEKGPGASDTDTSKGERNMVRLKNGAVEFGPLVRATMMTLTMLADTDPIALFELAEKCNNPNHNFFSKSIAARLEELSLVHSDGSVHESIRHIVVSAIAGQGLDMVLGSPIAEVQRSAPEADIVDGMKDDEAHNVSSRTGELLSQKDLQAKEKALAKMNAEQRARYERARDAGKAVKDAIKEALRK